MWLLLQPTFRLSTTVSSGADTVIQTVHTFAVCRCGINDDHSYWPKVRAAGKCVLRRWMGRFVICSLWYQCAAPACMRMHTRGAICRSEATRDHRSLDGKTSPTMELQTIIWHASAKRICARKIVQRTHLAVDNRIVG